MIIFWIDTIESIKLESTQTTHASHMFSHVYTCFHIFLHLFMCSHIFSRVFTLFHMFSQSFKGFLPVSKMGNGWGCYWEKVSGLQSLRSFPQLNAQLASTGHTLHLLNAHFFWWMHTASDFWCQNACSPLLMHTFSPCTQLQLDESC